MSQDTARKHGNIMISTLRKIYGDDFAKGLGPTAKLSDAFESLDEDDRARLEAGDKDGSLDARIKSEMGL